MSWPVRIVAMASLFVARVADADDEAPLSLTWNAPTECPAGTAVTAEVRRILGSDTPHHAIARADVAKFGAEHWEVRLAIDVDGTRGERTLDAATCDALASATALIVAWSVDPGLARSAEPAERSPRSPAIPREPSKPLRVIASAGAVGDVGVLPSAGGAVEIAVGTLVGPFRVELAGSDWLAQDAKMANEGTRIHLLEGALRACFRPRADERFEIAPCVGAGLVHTTSDGFGETTPYPGQESTWGTLQAIALATYRIAGPLSLRTSLGVAAPLARTSFVVLDARVPDGHLTLHKPSVVSARATLGMEVRFP